MTAKAERARFLAGVEWAAQQSSDVDSAVEEALYTPSLDEVRADYVRDHTHSYDEFQGRRTLTEMQEFYGDQFDRMIEVIRHEEREKAVRIAVQTHAYRGQVEQWAAREIASQIRSQGKVGM